MAYVLKEQGGKLDKGQRKLALTILRTGNRLHASKRDMVTALITGIQESGLRNLPVAAENSGGWRQEKAEYFPDPTNVKHSAARFFKELRHAHGGSVGEEAQRVQRSAYPSAYQPHVGEARAILKQLSPYINGSGGTTAPRASQRQAGKQRPQNIQSTQGYKLAALEFIKGKKDLSNIKKFVETKEVLGEGIPLGTTKQSNTQPGRYPSPIEGNKGLVKWASANIGTHEGSKKQVKWASQSGVSASQPWCSVFVAAGLRKQGYKLPPNPAYSGAWLSWSQGKKINYKHAKPGDLLIFDWGDGGITDHVGIYAGHGEYIAGNNSDNSVGRAPVPTGNIVGVVRPHKGKHG